MAIHYMASGGWFALLSVTVGSLAAPTQRRKSGLGVAAHLRGPGSLGLASR